jgi:hypothetical protein
MAEAYPRRGWLTPTAGRRAPVPDEEQLRKIGEQVRALDVAYSQLEATIDEDEKERLWSELVIVARELQRLLPDDDEPLDPMTA